MKLKNLFVIPEGQKISEKSLYRVLIANVCSILLCLTCLAGSTWAWFTVSLESTDNVIPMGQPQAKVCIGSTECSSGITMIGQSELVLLHENPVDSLNNRHDVYVTFTVNYAELIYDDYTVCLEGTRTEPLRVGLDADVSCVLSWSFSWFAPANATMLEDGAILVPSKVIREDLALQEATATTVPTTEGTTGTTPEPEQGSTTETTTGSEQSSTTETTTGSEQGSATVPTTTGSEQGSATVPTTTGPEQGSTTVPTTTVPATSDTSNNTTSDTSDNVTNNPTESTTEDTPETATVPPVETE